MNSKAESIFVGTEGRYSVDFPANWDSALLSSIEDRNYLIFTPERLKAQIEEKFPSGNVLGTLDGESQKSISSYAEQIEKIAEIGLERSAVLIGIGGGATTDLVGFLAATYMRGIDWIAVPTTLAGMVDAAIGGKTGINLNAGKNLAGAFHSPRRVIVDLNWLESLPRRDLSAGLAESVKCGFIGDPKILDLIESGVEANLTEIIHRSIEVKAKVVTTDFRESLDRESLNYGHTLGHAIEKHSNYQLRHGEAISIGLVFAAALSHKFSGLDERIVERHSLILKSLNLPFTYNLDAWTELVDYMSRDKKRISEKLRFVTLTKPGETARVEVSAEEIENLYRDCMTR